MNFLVIILTIYSAQSAFSIPILSSDETRLDSIVISEIDLPTESSLLVVVDKDVAREPESSFHELIEKYDEKFIKNSQYEESSVHKRSSTDDDEDEEMDVEAGGKSIIEKIHFADPEVRKEFEIELEQNQIGEQSTEIADIATDYDPNYASKMIIVHQSENATKLSVHEKEVLQVHLVEQLVHSSEDSGFTTIVPEQSFAHHESVKNPEIVEVLEHIVYETNNELRAHEHTTLNPVVIVVDPIEIIPKDRHRLGRDDDSNSTDDNNDKFAGFVGIPSEDLIQPGDEVTQSDNFFKKTEESDEETAVEAIRETLEYVAIYGKSLDIDVVTTQAPSFENVTEIVEINTNFTVNVEINASKDSSEESSQSNKSSSESEEKIKTKKIDSVESGEKIKSKKLDKDDSGESSEENSGKEIFDDEVKSPNVLSVDLYKDTPNHEITKKDHPDGLEVAARSLNTEMTSKIEEIDDTITTTMTALYETFEEFATTISDGIKLTNDFRTTVESFRDDSEENKIVLDTLREAISSKNSKNPLVDVNDSEIMTLKDQVHAETKISIAVIPIVGVVSIAVLIGLYKIIRGRATSFEF